MRFTDARDDDRRNITLADDALAVAGTLTVSDDELLRTPRTSGCQCGTNYVDGVSALHKMTTTDADLITLAGTLCRSRARSTPPEYIKVASTKFTVDATGNTYADGTLGVKGVSTLQDDLLLSEDAAVNGTR